MYNKLKQATEFPIKDLWQYLADACRPIVLYGTGDGADKIIRTCRKYDLEISDVFASDDFYCKANGERRFFHDKMILSFKEITDKYSQLQKPIILLSFATTLPNVIEDISRIDETCELYIPDVPVVEGELFTYDFASENKVKIYRAHDLFADEISKDIYTSIILGRITGKIQTILGASDDGSFFYKLIKESNISSFADLGSYDGDTAAELLNISSSSLKKLYLFEPDAKTFFKLSHSCNILQNEFPNIEIEKHNIAAWNEKTDLIFSKKSSRGSTLINAESKVNISERSKIVTVKADSLDNVINGRSVDYIKYDVEGAEAEALEGSSKTILAHSPILCISLYHRPGDIFRIPLMLSAKYPFYRFYLRRKRCLPLWEINLYAVPQNKYI